MIRLYKLKYFTHCNFRQHALQNLIRICEACFTKSNTVLGNKQSLQNLIRLYKLKYFTHYEFTKSEGIFVLTGYWYPRIFNLELRNTRGVTLANSAHCRRHCIISICLDYFHIFLDDFEISVDKY